MKSRMRSVRLSGFLVLVLFVTGIFCVYCLCELLGSDRRCISGSRGTSWDRLLLAVKGLSVADTLIYLGKRDL